MNALGTFSSDIALAREIPGKRTLQTLKFCQYVPTFVNELANNRDDIHPPTGLTNSPIHDRSNAP